MTGKARIAVVGAGNLGAALAVSLRAAGYRIDAVVAHGKGKSLRSARAVAKRVGARPVQAVAESDAEVVWFCVPDSAIAQAAREAASGLSWKKRVALHSSGALTSDELQVLRQRGASVASVHPLMTFVRGSRPALAGVAFAIEGDARAVRAARRIVQDLGGRAYRIRKDEKPAYHAWGTFASPLLTALLATTEQVAFLAGIGRKEAARRMMPILQKTLENYSRMGAAAGFSGPIVRGDVETVKRHLDVLRQRPMARDVYVALAGAAVELLPSRRRKELRALLDSEKK